MQVFYFLYFKLYFSLTKHPVDIETSISVTFVTLSYISKVQTKLHKGTLHVIKDSEGMVVWLCKTQISLPRGTPNPEALEKQCVLKYL